MGIDARAVRSRVALLAPYLLVGVVAGGVGAFGVLHEADYRFGLLGRSYLDATRLKAWITCVVAGLALAQLGLALWLYGRLPAVGQAPRWAHRAHRTNGYLTIALTLPVAVHCLLAYGFQTGSPRLAVHSVAGCVFYGLFAGKVCLVRDRRQPPWALPVVGGLLVTVIGLLWYSAALWALHGYHVPLLS